VLWHLLRETQAGPYGAFVQAQTDSSVLIGLCGGRRYDVPAATVPTLMLLLLDLTWKRDVCCYGIRERARALGFSEEEVDVVLKGALVAADQRDDRGDETGALAVMAIRVACATTREELLEACRFDAQEYWR
jgi:hypothetical protein